MKLLNIDKNAKTVKGQAQGYMTAVLYLAPFKAAGINVCPMAEIAGCVNACLNTAGRGGLAKAGDVLVTEGGLLPNNSVQRARIAKTRWYAEDRDGFMAALVAELIAFCRKATRAGLIPVVRLNGTSDIRWESIPVIRNHYRDGIHEIPGGRPVQYPHIFAAFNGVQFYDYTKISNRRVADIPNYRLTFSYSARPEYQPHVERAMAAGLNIVAVFRGALPETFLGRPVIDGDASDLRHLDPLGVVVGLKAKGRAKTDRSGFVVG
jgi:hypothetical protein